MLCGNQQANVALQTLLPKGRGLFKIKCANANCEGTDAKLTSHSPVAANTLIEYYTALLTQHSVFLNK